MSNIPSTHMNRFCSSIDQKSDRGSVCMKWFDDATEHCASLISHSKGNGPYIWRTMVGFVFPEQPSTLMSMEHPVRIPPNRLTLSECGYIYQDLVDDYVGRANRFSASSLSNILLWQLVYSLLVFMFMGMLFGAIKLYEKYAYMKKLVPDIFDHVICKQKAASRSLRIAKEEVYRLKVLKLINIAEHIAADGTVTMVIKVYLKLECLDAVVRGFAATTSRLYRRYDRSLQLKNEYKLHSARTVMNFVGNALNKLRLLIVFDEEPAADINMIMKYYTDFSSDNSTTSSAGGDSPRNTIKKAAPKSDQVISPKKKALTSPRSGTSRARTSNK